MQRREFLSLTIAAGSSALLQGAEGPAAQFPSDPRKRLSVSTYPFRSLIKAPRREGAEQGGGMTLEQFAPTVPGKLSVTGIEPWSVHFASTEPEYLHHLRSAFDKAGVHVVNIPVDLNPHLCEDDPQKHQAGLEAYHRWVDAAVILGAPGIRVHVPTSRGDKPDLACAVRSLKELAEYGAEKNIAINLENDDPHSEDPFTIVKLIETVNSPWLRALPDFCNSMLISNDAAYNNRGLAAMFPHAYNISHVKDQEIDDNKTYTVDVPHIFGVARKAGYKGYFSMEWEGRGDPYEGTRRLLDVSLKSLG